MHTLWEISLQKQFFMVEMQLFCKKTYPKMGSIIKQYSFVCQCNYFASKIQFICIFMNCNCKCHGFSKYYKTCTKFMHDFLNILQYKSKTKPIQNFCYYFQRFSLFSPDNTKSLQTNCNPFQNFCFLLQNITKPMQNFCILFKNVCTRMQKSCEEWHHLNQIKTNSQSFLVEERF